MNTTVLAEKLFKFLCSLKLAVLIILSLLVISAWGTIVESRYDMITAQKLVYHSWYMYLTLFMLIVNLIAVMVDRLPWKKRHTAFILAHIGIIILLVGSYITRKVGIDGTISFEIGETARYISLTDTDLIVYKLKDMEDSEKVFSQDVDFLVNRPENDPLEISVGEDKIKFLAFLPYAKKEFNIIEDDKITSGPAVRFQLQNEFINFTEWIVQSGSQFAKLNLGPAQIILAKEDYTPLGGSNEIVFLQKKNSKDVHYRVLNKEGKIEQSGVVAPNQEVSLPWMSLKLKLIQYIPKSQVQFNYFPLERPNPSSTSAVQVEFQGKKHWLGLNTYLQLFTDDSVYFVTYGNKRIDLGFPMSLEKFEVENYQGTRMAKSYKSIVNVPGVGQKEISMNEPLKHNGFTFYQSSFEEDRMGAPIASILSVNYDPGRIWKYLGSLLIVLGSIMLFYFKKFGKTEYQQKVEE